jgi:hypothetical protein
MKGIGKPLSENMVTKFLISAVGALLKVSRIQLQVIINKQQYKYASLIALIRVKIKIRHDLKIIIMNRGAQN